MHLSDPYLNPAEAARRLGVSTKALRLYEERGLLRPSRSAAGWRAYGEAAMARAGEIVALRRLGLSVAEVGRVLDGDAQTLHRALAAHEAGIGAQLRGLDDRLGLLRALRSRLAIGQSPGPGELAHALATGRGMAVSFALPWPWGGETFELLDLAPMTFIVGPLGSGKTRLAQRLAEVLPGAVFSGLDRVDQARGDPGDMVHGVLARLLADGATQSPALIAVAQILAGSEGRMTVVDLIEHGLDAASQLAVGDMLRQRRPDLPPMLVMTRSTAILDLASVGSGTALLLCPANHSPPVLVPPYRGAQGYEALESCLASPEVRARSEGVVVMLPKAVNA